MVTSFILNGLKVLRISGTLLKREAFKNSVNSTEFLFNLQLCNVYTISHFSNWCNLHQFLTSTQKCELLILISILFNTDQRVKSILWFSVSRKFNLPMIPFPYLVLQGWFLLCIRFVSHNKAAFCTFMSWATYALIFNHVSLLNSRLSSPELQTLWLRISLWW